MELRDEQGLTEAEFLAAYRPADYPSPAVTVDMIVFAIHSILHADKRKSPKKELEVLLIRRKNHPFLHHWAIPGGFVNIDESLDDAAKRELQEETGLQQIYLEQLYTWGEVHRDPRMRVISTSYMALVNREQFHPKPGDDAMDAAWFSITLSKEEDGMLLQLYNREKDIRIRYRCFQSRDVPCFSPLDTQLLAFDHVQILYTALTRLRSKIQYAPLVFKLMPEEFTLTELQRVFEAILGYRLFKAGFRRKISPYVVSTGIKESGVKYRPGEYFRFHQPSSPQLNLKGHTFF